MEQVDSGDVSFFRQRLQAFRFACHGVRLLWRSQFHSKLHLTATVTVVAAASLLSVSVAEWCLLILAIGLVWLAEALNTALEFAVDLISPDHHDLAGMAKDTAAGAVLLAAATSAAVGFIILGPKLLSVLAT